MEKILDERGHLGGSALGERGHVQRLLCRQNSGRALVPARAAHVGHALQPEDGDAAGDEILAIVLHAAVTRNEADEGTFAHKGLYVGDELLPEKRGVGAEDQFCVAGLGHVVGNGEGRRCGALFFVGICERFAALMGSRGVKRDVVVLREHRAAGEAEVSRAKYRNVHCKLLCRPSRARLNE